MVTCDNFKLQLMMLLLNQFNEGTDFWIISIRWLSFFPNLILMIIMMMMIMTYFYGMLDRRNTSSFTSSRGHSQRCSSLRISDTSQAGFEPALNLGSGLVEWSCAVVITTTTPQLHTDLLIFLTRESLPF